MSNLPIRIDDRRVIVSVLVLLMAVVTLNWRVFQPLRSGRADQTVTAEESVYVPEDLDGMKGVASHWLTGEGTPYAAALAGDGAGGAGVRDPFRKASDPAPPVRKVAKGSGPRRESAPTCTAVLLGGEWPTALINGRARRPGDRVAGYRVERVDKTGVLLAGQDGSLFLPVGGTAADAVHHPPVRNGAKK